MRSRFAAALSLLALSACSSNPGPGKSSDAAAGGSGTTAGGSATGGGQSNTAGGTSAEGGTSNTTSGGAGGTTSAGGSAGQAATGGSAGSGGSSTVPHTVGQCDDLAATGTWEDVSPPIDLNGGSGFGINAFAVDPQVSGTVYVGTSSLGIWKTTDCGSSWVHINTGENSGICEATSWTGKTCAALLDTGRQWAIIVDPTDSDTVYATNGYSEGSSGAFKSTNGGVDWDNIWPVNAPELADQAPDFIGDLKMDPDNPQHLMTSFHADCTGSSSICFGESTDGGDSWSLIWGDPEWGGEKGFVYIPSGETLLLGTQDDGLFQTTDHGVTFDQLTGSVAHSPGQLYRSPSGTFYLGTNDGVLTSPDAQDWSLIPNSGQLVGGVIGDGTNLYASSYAVCFKWGDDLHPYITAPENAGSPWTAMESPGFIEGGIFAHDPDHKILYSGNCQQGFFRVVLP